MSRRGWWLFAAMSVIWGIPYLLIKVAVGGVSPPVLVLARVSIGAALLLPIAIRRRELAPLLSRWRWVALFAVVEIITPWLLLSEAETRLSSSLSGLLIASVPILVAVIGRATGGQDRLTAVRWAGLLVGLAGVGLLVAGGGTHGHLTQVAEVLLVAVCYAIGPLIVARKLSDLPSLGVTAASLGFATVVYAPIAAFTWPSAVPAAKVLAALAGLAVVCTALAFLGFFALIAEAGPARATVITYVNPAVAVALGVLVLGERLTVTMGVAFVAILGGSVLATRTSRPAAEAAGTAGESEASPEQVPAGGLSKRAPVATRLDSRG
ncbi:MAG TPA: EamA family transporter [Streptosporangiaceae bacterium]|nr:EamA family transporter [Streptosporangiaceae bacterium]